MKIELKFIALKMEFKLDLCFYKKTFRVNSVHLITFDFFFLKATTCSKWLSCLCAELVALVVFKKKESVSLIFYFNVLGQNLENSFRSNGIF